VRTRESWESDMDQILKPMRGPFWGGADLKDVNKLLYIIAELLLDAHDQNEEIKNILQRR
jgi:hypothetical protein